MQAKEKATAHSHRLNIEYGYIMNKTVGLADLYK